MRHKWVRENQSKDVTPPLVGSDSAAAVEPASAFANGQD
jgi:hypothetical protein